MTARRKRHTCTCASYPFPHQYDSNPTPGQKCSDLEHEAWLDAVYGGMEPDYGVSDRDIFDFARYGRVRT